MKILNWRVRVDVLESFVSVDTKLIVIEYINDIHRAPHEVFLHDSIENEKRSFHLWNRLARPRLHSLKILLLHHSILLIQRRRLGFKHLFSVNIQRGRDPSVSRDSTGRTAQHWGIAYAQRYPRSQFFVISSATTRSAKRLILEGLTYESQNISSSFGISSLKSIASCKSDWCIGLKKNKIWWIMNRSDLEYLL